MSLGVPVRAAPWREDEPRRALHHDLRQSLTVVLSLVSVIEHSLARPREVLERLEQMRREAEWMTTLMTSDDPQTGAATAVDVGEVAQQVWRSANAAGKARLRLVLDAETVVSADATALARCLRNLVDNAVRAAGPGGAVVITVEADEHTVSVVVDDDGPGFGKILRQQGHGLTLVRRFALAYDGSVGVGTSPSGGTRMVLRLPRKAALPPGSDDGVTSCVS